MKSFLTLLLTLGLGISALHADEPQKKVLLDTHFNHEVDQKTGRVQHYTWDDTSKWGGYSQFGDLFLNHGAQLDMLDAAPTTEALRGYCAYIIVDPDHVKDNPQPNYMDRQSAKAIAKWVKKGGHLLVLTNDQANCDLQYINILMEQFGIHFNDTTILQLDIPTKEKPENPCPLEGLLPNPVQYYMRGTCSIDCGKKVQPILWTPNHDVVIAKTRYGKGLVIAVADPWIYNEYIYHTLLPDNYDNAAGAEWMVRQLLGIE